MKVFSNLVVASLMLVPLSVVNAGVVLNVGAMNPNGTPDTGTQWVVRLVLSGDQLNPGETDGTVQAALFVSGAIQSTAPTYQAGFGGLADPDNVHFNHEALAADALDGTYKRVNDSYMGLNWVKIPVSAGGTNPSGPMNLPAVFLGNSGVNSSINDRKSPGTYDYAYITVPNGGTATLTTRVTYGGNASGPTTESFTLTDGGQLNPVAVPEPSAFLLLGLLGVVQGVRFWRRKRDA